MTNYKPGLYRRPDGQVVEVAEHVNPDGTTGTHTVISLETTDVSYTDDDGITLYATGYAADEVYEVHSAPGCDLDEIVSRKKLRRYLKRQEQQRETPPCRILN